MSVNGTAAYGIYPRNVPLLDVVTRLNEAGFENQDICMVLSPAHPVATGVGDAQIGDTREHVLLDPAGLGRSAPEEAFADGPRRKRRRSDPAPSVHRDSDRTCSSDARS